MLLDQTIEVFIIAKTLKHYRELGYDPQVLKMLTIKTTDLPYTSKYRVRCKCFNCNIENEVSYQSYYSSVNDTLIKDYYCKKCAKFKTLRSLELTYGEGVTNVSQLENTQIKIKETSVKKYGVEHFSQAECVKEAKIETSMKNYGVSNPLQSDEIKNHIKETNTLLYGFDNVSKNEEIKEKKRITTFSNHGVEYSFSSSEIREKSKKTSMLLYGTEYPIQSKIIQERSKLTCQNKYGVDYSLQAESVKQKSRETNIINLGVDNQFKIVDFTKKYRDIKFRNRRMKMLVKYSEQHKDYEFIDYSEESIFTIKHSGCNKESFISIHNIIDRTNGNIPICTQCYPISDHSSIVEKELFLYVDSLGVIPIKDRTVLNGKELDIYIPSHNLAIEFNGNRYHSELFIKSDYHLQKSNQCKDKGVKLIHIFEDEWQDKRDVVKNLIKYELGLFDSIVKNYTIVELNESEIIHFIDKNTLMRGNIINDGVAGYGLFDEDKKLVTVLYYKKSTNFVVINIYNIASKSYDKLLFDHFINLNNGINIIAYHDYRLCNIVEDVVFYRFGFKLDSILEPSFYWYKSKCPKILNTAEIDEEKMVNEKYIKIYNSGHLKFTYKL